SAGHSMCLNALLMQTKRCAVRYSANGSVGEHDGGNHRVFSLAAQDLYGGSRVVLWRLRGGIAWTLAVELATGCSFACIRHKSSSSGREPRVREVSTAPTDLPSCSDINYVLMRLQS